MALEVKVSGHARRAATLLTSCGFPIFIQGFWS